MCALDETADGQLLDATKNTRLYLPVLLAVTTGMRRGEILGLRWQDVNFETGTLSISQSLEETTEGVRVKQPKTRQSRRTVKLPAPVVETLRRHRVEQFERRQVLGDFYRDQGYILAEENGGPVKPNHLSQMF
jgi:integrase